LKSRTAAAPTARRGVAKAAEEHGSRPVYFDGRHREVAEASPVFDRPHQPCRHDDQPFDGKADPALAYLLPAAQQASAAWPA